MVTFTETKDLVEKFITENFDVGDEVYPSDVTEALDLDYSLVVDVFAELKKERKLE